MQLLFLFLMLILPYGVLSLVARSRSTPAARARVGLSVFFAFTALGHFARTQEMTAMLPSFVPNRTAIIYLTGVLELMGAIGIWHPRLMSLTGKCLILMLVGLIPANIYSAIERVPFGGHEAGPVYLMIRIPFQLLLIWWVYFATEQSWFQGKPAESPEAVVREKQPEEPKIPS